MKQDDEVPYASAAYSRAGRNRLSQSQERVILSAPGHLPGVQTLAVDDCEPRIWRAYHETFTTCVILRTKLGPAQWSYRGKAYSADVGTLMLMEPGETHSNIKVFSGSFHVLLVAPVIVKQAVAGLGGSDSAIHFKNAQTIDSELFAAFRDLATAIGSDASMLEQQSRFAACLNYLARECIEFPLNRDLEQTHSPAVRKVKAYLSESFHRNVSLEELEAVSGISRYHLVRNFKHEVGIPPHAYQIQLQLSAARRSLRKGHSISAAAADAGFSDQSHFARHFKRFWGTTPKAFAESAKPKSLFFPKQFAID